MNGATVRRAVYNTTTGNYIRSAVSSNPSGVVGGGHVGYDYQISQFVLGLEGDIDGASYQGTALQTPLITSRIRIPVDGAVLGRAGVAFDRVLVYATGGVAFGDLETTLFSPTLDDTTANSASAGRSVAGFNTPSTTIGRSMPNIAIRITAIATSPWST